MHKDVVVERVFGPVSSPKVVLGMSSFFAGVDVAKASLVVCLLDEQDRVLVSPRSFPNALHGFRKLLEVLRKALPQDGQTHDLVLGLESTGVYGQKLLRFLCDKQTQGVTPYLLNPAQVKHFAHTRFVRTKTDEVDARTIAATLSYGVPRGLFKPWTPPPTEEKFLKDLVRRREALVEMIRMEKNRLEALLEDPEFSPLVQENIQKTLDHLERSLKDLDRRIRDHIDSHPGLKERADLLESIPGIGPICSSLLIGEAGNLSRFSSVKQLVAYIGLAPREKISGTSVHAPAHIGKQGNPWLRKGLYMAALSGIRYNPILASFFQNLVQRGKPKKAALLACVRKLVHIAYGVLKHQTPFCWPQETPGVSCP